MMMYGTMILVNCRVATEFVPFRHSEACFQTTSQCSKFSLCALVLRRSYQELYGAQLAVSSKEIQFFVVTWRRTNFKTAHTWNRQNM